MATIITPEMPEEQRNTWEQIVRVAALQADINLKQQQQRLAPWQLVLSGAAAGAGVLAAGGALVKLALG